MAPKWGLFIESSSFKGCGGLSIIGNFDFHLQKPQKCLNKEGKRVQTQIFHENLSKFLKFPFNLFNSKILGTFKMQYDQNLAIFNPHPPFSTEFLWFINATSCKNPKSSKSSGNIQQNIPASLKLSHMLTQHIQRAHFCDKNSVEPHFC